MLKGFRKNKKAWMAVLTILAMFAFVFFGPWSFQDSGGHVRNPEVFSWKFGKVHASDLQYRLQMRHLVDLFLFNAGVLADNPPQQVQQLVNQIFPPTEQGVVTSMLLARKAEQMGLAVNDDAVNRFIRQWTADRVPREQLVALIQNMRAQRGHLTAAELFDALRFELMALYARELVTPLFLRSETPADQWDAYCRLNRKVTAQFMPVSVEDFVSQVAAPSEEVLLAFYDQYRNALPNPQTPTPGFREPYKAQFQYLKADFEKFSTAQSPKVTEEEIQVYYDKYKDVFFRKTEFPETGSDVMPGEKLDDAEPGSTDAEPAAGKSAEQPKQSTSPPASSAPQTPASSKDAPSKGKTDGKQSGGVPANRSLDGELLAQADTKAAKDSDASTKAGPAAQTNDLQSAAESDAKAVETEAEAERPVEYEPLDKVKEVIRSRLVAEKFDQQVNEGFMAIRSAMEDYRNAMARYRADVASGITTARQPERPDLAAMAMKHNLELIETELISDTQAADGLDIAKSYRMTPGSYNAAFFIQAAFRPTTPLFQPDQTEDSENNRYLWWKIAEENTRTPPLDDIKDKVIHAWKMVQARSLTEVKAKEYAAKANEAKQPLDKLFTEQDVKIIAAGPFTWLTRQVNSPTATPTITEVPGLDFIGNAFMRAVFGLKAGEAGVAPNPQQTVYYVAQVQSEEPSIDELRQNYMSAMGSDTSSYIYQVITRQNRALEYYKWLNDLKSEFGFKMAPDASISESPEDDRA